MGREIGVPIKPAITPDMIPDIFQFPEMSYPPDVESTLGSRRDIRILKQDPSYGEQVAVSEEVPISVDAAIQNGPSSDPNVNNMTVSHSDASSDRSSEVHVRNDVMAPGFEKEEKKGPQESTKNVPISHTDMGPDRSLKNETRRNAVATSDAKKEDLVRDSISMNNPSIVKPEQLPQDFFKIPEQETNHEIGFPLAFGLIPDSEKNSFVHKVEEKVTSSKGDLGHKAPDLRKTKRGIVHPTHIYAKTNSSMPENPILYNVSTSNKSQISEPSKHKTAPPQEPNMKSMHIRDQVEIIRRPEPEVTVNIGRIEIRSTPQQRPAGKPSQFPPLSLKDYLKQRAERKS